MVGYTDLVHVQEICGFMTKAVWAGFGPMLTTIPYSILTLSLDGFGLMKLVPTESFTTSILAFGGRTTSLFR